jgi:hypothetical protein
MRHSVIKLNGAYLFKDNFFQKLLDCLNHQLCNRLCTFLFRHITECNDKCNLIINLHPQLTRVSTFVEICCVPNTADILILIERLAVIDFERRQDNIAKMSLAVRVGRALIITSAICFRAPSD